MAESWRNILERAADNLSIDLDQRSAMPFPNAQPLRRRPGPAPRNIHSFAETRELLARELRALSGPQSAARRPHPAPQPPQMAAQPAIRSNLPALVPPQGAKRAPARAPARKRAAWRNVLVILCSCVITAGAGVAAYSITSREPAREAAAVQPPRPQEDRAVRAAPAAVLGRATEDALLARAADQMTHGDGAGARAVYEVLAHYGSPRGAFSLAETYDADALAKRPARGLVPDVRLAREWYAKAAELGSPAAFKRMQQLEKTGVARQGSGG
jgi:hypothetical protein